MATEIKVPSVGESITEVTIAQWLKEDGDYVEMDDALAEIESDKASFEVNAEQAGILRISAEEGETVEIGTVIASIEEGEPGAEKAEEAEPKKEEPKEKPQDKAAPKAAPEQPAAEKAPAGNKEETYATGHASPAAAKILREKGISAEQVEGTGKDGRITKEDAQNASAEQPKAKDKPKQQPVKEAAPPKMAMESDQRGTSRERLSTLRKTIARRLVSAKNETAMLTTFNEVDMKAIMDLRSEYKESFKKKHEVGLGFMSFFVKAVCGALEEFPQVNGSLDGDEVIFHNYCDVSIAVSSPRGLVVPVIRNAEQKSFAEVEKSVMDLATRARDNKLSIEEMQGGTFTITNGGIFGSMLSTPIINPPQSAILGMHNIVERPVVVNGEITVRPIMYVALSYDHRIIDGKESVSFLYRVKEYLENPARLLLEI